MHLPSRTQMIDYAKKVVLIVILALLATGVLVLLIGATIWNAHYGQPVVIGNP